MWATLLYATKLLISLWNLQIRALRAPPKREQNIHNRFQVQPQKFWTQRKPTPPIFRRIPARIIDPTVGASTCALGSHIWRRNSGSFTINAALIMSLRRALLRRREALSYIRAPTSNGLENRDVYTKRWYVAEIRSGWIPHPIIRIIIGRRESSKII